MFQVYKNYVVVLDTTKVQIFKQITTTRMCVTLSLSCFRYHKGTDFQANHNRIMLLLLSKQVVLDTTKVQIFKQITTSKYYQKTRKQLFQIPQRYRFSSKSQRDTRQSFSTDSCFRYHKGTDFQANHNCYFLLLIIKAVVLDTTKVQIFKQITTNGILMPYTIQLFQIPQRYRFSSKSQQRKSVNSRTHSCFRYHKGTDFQANHN